MNHRPFPRLCDCGVVHRQPVSRRLAAHLRPFFGAVTAQVSGQWPAQLAPNWTADTIKVLLVTSLTAYNQDTTIMVGFASAVNTIGVNEVANANGYSTGGVTVTSKSVTYDAATNQNRFKGTIPAWTSSGAGFSAVGAIVYSSKTDYGVSPVIVEIDFGGSQSASNGGTFTITADATTGIYYAAPL